MTAHRSRLIREAFGKARDYDANATAQAASAARLASLIARRGLPAGARALDAGCGTGGLAAHLIASGLPGLYVCADISTDMLARARTRLAKSSPPPLLAAMDLAAPALKPGFDLVASNMALHWVRGIPAALAGLWELLAPGGLLAVAVPGNETFKAWRRAHERLGLPCGLQDFPSAKALAAMFPVKPDIVEERHVLNLERALDLPRHLKAVGGFVPRPGHVPLTPAQFRQVLAVLDADGSGGPGMGYHVLHALASKPLTE